MKVLLKGWGPNVSVQKVDPREFDGSHSVDLEPNFNPDGGQMVETQFINRIDNSVDPVKVSYRLVTLQESQARNALIGLKHLLVVITRIWIVVLTADCWFPFLDLDKLAGDLAAGVEAPVELGIGSYSLPLVLELHIHVPSQMWLVVTTYLQREEGWGFCYYRAD